MMIHARTATEQSLFTCTLIMRNSISFKAGTVVVTKLDRLGRDAIDVIKNILKCIRIKPILLTMRIHLYTIVFII